MNSRRLALFGAAALSVGMLSACGSSGKSGAAQGGSSSGPAQAKPGGSLTLLGTTAPAKLDPITAYNAGNRVLSRIDSRLLFMYDSVGTVSQQTTVEPDIATAIPTKSNGGISSDGKTYTIHLRHGVKWDSTPARDVVAGDFVREFKMLCNPVAPVPAPEYYTQTIEGMASYCQGFEEAPATVAGIQSYVDNTPLSGVSASDPSTLVFHLVQPANDFLNILAMEFSAARPAEYMSYLPDSAQLYQHLLSDGPYVIASYQPGISMSLSRNPAWSKSTDHLRNANVNTISIKFGVSADNVQQQLQVGTADLPYGDQTPPQDLPGLISQKSSGLALSSSYTALNYLALNLYAGPMKNQLVREAVAYAVDKNLIVQLGGGPALNAVTDQVSLPGSSGYVSSLHTYDDSSGNGNPTKARALLAQAGYPHGVTVTLAYNSSAASGVQIAQAYQSSLQKAGFTVKLLSLSGSTFVNDIRNPQNAEKDMWDIAPAGWGPDWYGNNGRASLVPILSSPGKGSTDYGGYDSSAFNQDAQDALTAATPGQAQKYWAAANTQAIKDAAIVPVLDRKATVFHSTKVQGCSVVWWYGQSCDLANIWLS